MGSDLWLVLKAKPNTVSYKGNAGFLEAGIINNCQLFGEVMMLGFGTQALICAGLSLLSLNPTYESKKMARH